MSAYRLSSVGFAVQRNFCENFCGFLLPALRRQGAVSARLKPVGRAGRSRHFRFSSVYGCGVCVPTLGNRFLTIAVWPRRVNPNIEYSGGRGDGTMKEVPEKTLSKLLMPTVGMSVFHTTSLQQLICIRGEGPTDLVEDIYDATFEHCREKRRHVRRACQNQMF